MRKRIVFSGALLLLLGVIYVYLTPFIRVNAKVIENTHIVLTQNEIAQLHSAIQSYCTEYDDVPSGNSAAIIRTLTGANQRHVTYWEFPPSRRAPNGSYLDPWGTPYHIAASPTEFRTDSDFQISSAGPDRVFGTSDDIAVTKKPR